MDVNTSNCLHCKREIHYSEAKLLPEGGGVCQRCASKCGYVSCAECRDYFIPAGEDEHFCEICLKRIFARLI